MKINIETLALLIIINCSCQKETLPNESVNGIWQSIGSGWVLQVKDSTQYALFDITSMSCLPNHQGGFEEISKSLTLRGDTLSLLKGVITYQFIRAEQMPESCNAELPKEKQKDPLFNFEVFAETVKEHYAFLQLNQVKWDSLYKEQKDKLSPNTTEVELYGILEETLAKLNDNHAYLEATEEVYHALETQLPEEPEQIGGQENLTEYGDFQIAQMVAEHHLQEEMTKDSWLIQWGKLNDDIGYIQVKAMWLYAKLDIPEALIKEIGYIDAYVETFHQMYEGDYIEKEVEGIRKIMDNLMDDLSDMEAIVIDIRFNGGGQDAVSFEILSRFISDKLQVATQKLRFGNSFSPTLALNINGTPNAYAKPVYVLTSKETGSAAEAFAIATLSIEKMKRIGSPTAGAMSTALEKSLPNGWEFSISNEIYMDNQGINYENEGVPVDYDLNYPKDRQAFFRNIANDLEGDRRAILDAIAALNEGL